VNDSRHPSVLAGQPLLLAEGAAIFADPDAAMRARSVAASLMAS